MEEGGGSWLLLLKGPRVDQGRLPLRGHRLFCGCTVRLVDTYISVRIVIMLQQFELAWKGLVTGFTGDNHRCMRAFVRVKRTVYIKLFRTCVTLVPLCYHWDRIGSHFVFK